jgi:hypothetical protein
MEVDVLRDLAIHAQEKAIRADVPLEYPSALFNGCEIILSHQFSPKNAIIIPVETTTRTQK